MTNRLKLIAPAGILMAGFMLCTSASYGKPEYAKKEGMKCLSCHTKMGPKPELNDTGKCYQSKEHSMEGCKNPEKK